MLFSEVKAETLASAEVGRDYFLDDMTGFSDARAARRRATRGIYRRYLKRAFDLAAVLLAAPFALPVVALLALLVRRDGGPAFYCQNRVGREGRTFCCWKLRSMVVDAETQLAAHVAACPAARAEWTIHQKLRNDPRITRIGRMIRKTSLDELPQLWNVLVGDMSLVGPRPMMPEQQGLYPGRAYFELRPGLTGFWQISERNSSSFAARAEHDSAYHARLSFLTDVLVLMLTAWVVLRGTGY